MDTLVLKIKKHQDALTKYLMNLANYYNNSLGNELTYQAVIDTHNNHFQLLKLGWTEDRFYYNILMHFDIHPETGNIWVQQNNTEILIDEGLEEYDIRKKDFVLGFRPESMRPHSKYAVM